MARHTEEHDVSVGVRFASDDDSMIPVARTALQILYAALTTVGGHYRVESHQVEIYEVAAFVELQMDDGGSPESSPE